jgi:serine/threonine protein kinase
MQVRGPQQAGLQSKTNFMAVQVPFGRYVLLEKLASGGMAELFLAKALGEAGFEKTCVIKKVLPHLAVDDSFVTMFLDEARLAARLNHPGVVQIFDLGCVDEQYFFAMEYLAGEDVANILSRCRRAGRLMPVDIAAKIAAATAEALNYAHELSGADGKLLGIVHRDVSPANLFVTYQGVVKVLDFGIARAEARATQTRPGTIKGKVPYLAPEQLLGKTLDRRADVWSLGLCLHEMLTGKRMLGRKDGAEVPAFEGTVVRPREIRSDVPEALDEIVMRALQHDRERRYPKAAAMYDELDDFLSTRTYAPQASQLAAFLRELFGEERASASLARAVGAAGSVPRRTTEELGIGSNPSSVSVAAPTVVATTTDRPVSESTAVTHPPSSGALLSRHRLAFSIGFAATSLVALILVLLSRSAGTDASRIIPASEVRTEVPPPAVVPPLPSRAVAPPLPLASPPPEPVRADVAASMPVTRRALAEVVERERPKAPRVKKPSHAQHADDEVRRPRGKGYLNVAVVPWADVWLDDVSVGQTPLAAYEVTEGHHVLRLRNPQGEKTLTFEVADGQTRIVKERLP